MIELDLISTDKLLEALAKRFHCFTAAGVQEDGTKGSSIMDYSAGSVTGRIGLVKYLSELTENEYNDVLFPINYIELNSEEEDEIE